MQRAKEISGFHRVFPLYWLFPFWNGDAGRNKVVDDFMKIPRTYKQMLKDDDLPKNRTDRMLAIMDESYNRGLFEAFIFSVVCGIFWVIWK